jgi:hypothetical protein
MSESKKLLAELRQKVAEAKNKLEEQENALRIVENMLDDSTEEVPGASAIAPFAEHKEQESTRTGLPVTTSTGTIVDNVTAVLPYFSGRSYTVSDVYGRMKEIDESPVHKSSISTILRKMAIREKIEIVTQGKGKAPSVYREKKETNFF